MNRRDAVLTIPAAIAAAVLTPLRKLKANPAPAGSRDVVRQVELQAVIDAQNRVEVLAANIRRRLEAGAEFERGELGASAWGHDPLSELGIGDADHCDGFGILDIRPAEDHIAFREEVLQEHPELAAEVAARVWA